MSPMSLFLAYLLALQPAAATPAGSSCDLFDKRCKAELSLKRAKTAKNDEHRARYLFYAYRDYLFLFDQTGDASAVCKARRAFDESVAVKGQSSAQRESFMAEVNDLVSRERKAGVRCQNAPKRPSADPPRLAKKPAKERATTPTGTTPSGKPPGDASGTVDETSPAPTSTAGETSALATTAQPHAPDVDPLLPVTGRSPAPGGTLHEVGAGETPSPQRVTAPSPSEVDRPAGELRSPIPRATRRPGRELLIAGGVTLGAGLGLATAAGVMGGHMLDTWREVQALRDEVGPIGTEAQAAKDAALTRDYERQRAPMVATAIVGTSAIIVGAVLVGVGAKRLARAASHAVLLPAPGGLVLHARF